MNKIIVLFTTGVFIFVIGVGINANDTKSELIEYERVEQITSMPKNEPIESIKQTEETPFSDNDINLLALVTMAEAEGESEKGKRLVIDTILNRVDSKYFPDTIHDVIYQSYQFSVMTNGRVDRCFVRDDIRQLVIEELESRTNHDVIFFTAGSYSKYGVPLFRVDNHYFSKYD